jgi:spore maturation protein B
MSLVFSLIVPAVIGSVAVFALARKVDVFDAMTTGALDGLKVIVKILPALVALLTGVAMLRASGALDALTGLCRPLFSLLGIPPETAALFMIRPISGSGALAVGSEIISQYGPDSLIGRTAAVMLGSTETTFYIIAVYFGAAGIKKTRYAIPAALCADLTGFLMASLTVRLIFGT